MENLDIKDFQSRSSVEKRDDILMVLSSGMGAKITVDLLLKVLLKDIQPSVNEKGELLFGGVSTGVVVTGKSPFLQASENGIEWKYEGETSLRPLVSYEQLKLKFGDLTPEQIDELKLKLSDLTSEEIESLRGAQGIQGLIGKSAYQSAFENGYKGSEEQFGAEQSSIAGNGVRLTMVEQNKQDKPIAGRSFLTPLFVTRGAVFNDNTGYYELNGLADITEAQMMTIYNESNNTQSSANSCFALFYYNRMVTNFIPITGSFTPWDAGIYNAVNCRAMFRGCLNIKVVNLGERLKATNAIYFFLGCRELKTVLGIIDLSAHDQPSMTLIFGSCSLLESINVFGLKQNISLVDSPLLDRESILYMINNSINTTVITITLHPTAKVRLTEEDIALASSKNITIA